MKTYTVEIEGVYMTVTQDADGKFIVPDGWRGIGTGLKPAHEPVVLARKPLIGTVADNVLRFGTGALNIGGCRVESGADYHDLSVTQGGRQGFNVGGTGSGKRNGVFSPATGRWPANICHDSSPEVLAAFPETGISSGGKGEASQKTALAGHVYGQYSGATLGQNAGGLGDAGSAARFFACFPVENEARCDLCYMLLERENDTVKECNVTTAETPSQTPDILNAASVHADAAGSQVPENEGKRRQSKSRAPDAARHSRQCHQPSANTVQENAPTGQLSRTVQNVKSAASLCSSCATAIARALVGARPHQNGASPQFPASISGRNAQILSQHLALYVAGREGTDIILTTPSLKQLLGSVFHAIARSTPESAVEPKALSERSRRFWYGSKADQDDRLASRHPTVKPLDLMQWLVRLVTPRGGTVLDPFAGTGTTGEAAWREGMRAILIEREPEYIADIERRMDLASKPTKRAAVAKTKNNLDDPNSLPLFQSEAP